MKIKRNREQNTKASRSKTKRNSSRSDKKEEPPKIKTNEIDG